MALDVEAIWVALFDRLAAELGSTFRTYSRRRTLDPAPEQCPVLMLLDDSGNETAEGEDLPPVWTLDGEIVIVDRTQPGETTPSTALNALIKSVREALERKDSEPLGTGDFYGHVSHYTNLGGLVRVLTVRAVEKGSLGENSGQAVAKITLQMEALG